MATIRATPSGLRFSACSSRADNAVKSRRLNRAVSEARSASENMQITRNRQVFRVNFFGWMAQSAIFLMFVLKSVSFP